MNQARALCAILALSVVSLVSASELTDRVEALVPASVAVLSIQESDGHIELSGLAHSNDEISALMRAIDRAQLGDPELDSIRRESGMSRFQLRISLSE